MEPTQAQNDWRAAFTEKMSDVESAYHYWQNAQDRRHANRHAEEQDRLDHDSTVKGNRHSDAMRYLLQWVQANPYPAADQADGGQTVADSLREVNRLANLAEDKQQYRNGWNDAMEGVKDVQRQGKSPQEWAQRMCDLLANSEAGAYNRGSADALTHFLQSGQTDRHAP